MFWVEARCLTPRLNFGRIWRGISTWRLLSYRRAMSRTQNRPGRVTPKGTRPQVSTVDVVSVRASAHAPSATWVLALMGVLFAVGAAIIFANYLSWLPGSPDTIWLFVGLGGILGGIITATQYH